MMVWCFTKAKADTMTGLITSRTNSRISPLAFLPKLCWFGLRQPVDELAHHGKQQRLNQADDAGCKGDGGHVGSQSLVQDHKKAHSDFGGAGGTSAG